MVKYKISYTGFATLEADCEEEARGMFDECDVDYFEETIVSIEEE